MLVVTGPHHAVMQYDETVEGFAVFAVGADGADDHKQITQSVRLELGGEPIGLVPCGGAECSAQGKILDGIAGERHLGERHHPCMVGGGDACVLEHFFGVAVKVSYAGVDLCECEANISHACKSTSTSSDWALRLRDAAKLQASSSSRRSAALT